MGNGGTSGNLYQGVITDVEPARKWRAARENDESVFWALALGFGFGMCFGLWLWALEEDLGASFGAAGLGELSVLQIQSLWRIFGGFGALELWRFGARGKCCG